MAEGEDNGVRVRTIKGVLIGILVTQFIYKYYLVVDKGPVAEYLGRIWESPYKRS